MPQTKNIGKKRQKQAPVGQNTHIDQLVKPPSKRRRRKRGRDLEEEDYLTTAEFERLCAAAHASKRDEAIIRVCYCKALRASEVGAIDIRDYDRRNNTLYIRRLKGSRSGEYPLYDREATALRRYVAERGDEPGPLFLSRQGARPPGPHTNGGGISRQMLDVLMRKYAAIAGIPQRKRHLHVLKHTRGTQLNDEGVSVLMIQHELGHRDIRNTQKYAHISTPAKKAMFDRLKGRW
jgi:type 1 fimbriae regulatory protein FimB/type 1 fimbriae regulatory protein FimE